MSLRRSVNCFDQFWKFSLLARLTRRDYQRRAGTCYQPLRTAYQALGSVAFGKNSCSPLIL